MDENKQPVKYDDAEALEILATKAEQLQPDVAGRRRAATELLNAVEALSKSYSFIFKRHKDYPDTIYAFFPGSAGGQPDAALRYTHETGRFAVDGSGFSNTTLRLTYSRYGNCFVGPVVANEAGDRAQPPVLALIVTVLAGTDNHDYLKQVMET